MIYVTYNIKYLMYKKAYLLNRVINKALYRAIILPPYSPGVRPPRGLGGGIHGGDTPKDYTKPDRLYKAPNIRQSPRNTIQNPKILDKPKPFEHPEDLEVGPHPIIRNIHQTAPYSSSRLGN